MCNNHGSSAYVFQYGKNWLFRGQSGLINSIYTLFTSHSHTYETNGVCKPGNMHEAVLLHSFIWSFFFYILILSIPYAKQIPKYETETEPFNLKLKLLEETN